MKHAVSILSDADEVSPQLRAAPGSSSVGLPLSAHSMTWLNLVVLACVFAALFRFNLERLWQWTNPSSGDPNWGHALFIPLISLVYLLEHLDQLKQTPIQSARAGLLFVIGGIAFLGFGIALQSTFVTFGVYAQDLAMFTVLFGCVLAIFGWPLIRVAAFPLFYLLCALPWPPYVHEMLTIPLQKLAATVSVWLLQLTGLNVEQAGNTIHILSSAGADRALNVAEACSGMRSLITFLALGLAVAFLSRRPLWQKVIISLSAVPIAIACNIFRIVGEGLLDHYVSRKVSEGFAHSMVGLALLIPGLGLFFLVGWVLDRLVIADRPPENTPTDASRRSSSIVKDQSPVLSQRSVHRGRSSQRMYVVVLVILASAAVGLAATSHLLAFHFQKLAVPLVRPLTEIPADLGGWRQFGGNRSIDDDTQQQLGTTDYVFRDYVDERLVGDDIVTALRQNNSEGNALLHDIGASHPEALVRLAVTYYTGRVDAVVHQSERCNLAGGMATSVQSEPITWDVGSSRMDARIVRLINDTPDKKSTRYLAYCYCANGRRETEVWRVRSHLMNIFEPNAWYAKIEVTTGLSDRAQSERVMGDFLSSALAEIEKCLPPMQARDPVSEVKGPADIMR